MSLHDVHPDQVFKIKSGTVVRNLYDLSNELALMSEETFKSHVNLKKNEFQDWIFYIIHDVKLANTLAVVKDRRLMLSIVHKRIKELEQHQKPHHLWHLTAQQYLVGIVVGAVAMMMITRLL